MPSKARLGEIGQETYPRVRGVSQVFPRYLSVMLYRMQCCACRYPTGIGISYRVHKTGFGAEVKHVSR